MRLFHVAPMMLEAGSVILPGNWGRLINHSRRAKNASYFREIALEETRKLSFREKPSRFDCVFTFPSMASVRAYQSIDTNFFSSVYEVEPVLLAQSVFIACWRLGLLDEGRHDLADFYWRGLRVDQAQPGSMPVSVRVKVEDPFAEALVGGKVRIIRRLDQNDLEQG